MGFKTRIIALRPKGKIKQPLVRVAILKNTQNKSLVTTKVIRVKSKTLPIVQEIPSQIVKSDDIENSNSFLNSPESISSQSRLEMLLRDIASETREINLGKSSNELIESGFLITQKPKFPAPTWWFTHEPNFVIPYLKYKMEVDGVLVKVTNLILKPFILLAVFKQVVDKINDLQKELSRQTPIIRRKVLKAENNDHESLDSKVKDKALVLLSPKYLFFQVDGVTISKTSFPYTGNSFIKPVYKRVPTLSKYERELLRVYWDLQRAKILEVKFNRAYGEIDGITLSFTSKLANPSLLERNVFESATIFSEEETQVIQLQTSREIKEWKESQKNFFRKNSLTEIDGVSSKLFSKIQNLDSLPFPIFRFVKVISVEEKEEMAFIESLWKQAIAAQKYYYQISISDLEIDGIVVKMSSRNLDKKPLSRPVFSFVNFLNQKELKRSQHYGLANQDAWRMIPLVGIAKEYNFEIDGVVNKLVSKTINYGIIERSVYDHWKITEDQYKKSLN